VTEARISVAVPARDEERSLAALLDSLLLQTRLPAEILIADGGSSDGTVSLAKRYAEQGVRVLELGSAYPGRGRNAAAAAARHEWVAFVDAGCVADPSWLEALARASEAGDAAIVYGGYEPVLRTEWDMAQALAFLPPLAAVTGVRGPSTASLLVRRSAWNTLGGFREDLRAAEDLLFFERVEAAQLTVAWAPGAVVRWSLAPSPQAVYRRLRLYSRHHLAAGLFRTWHRRVFAMDAVAVAWLGLALWQPLWLLPLALAALLRLGRTVWRRRRNVPGGAFRPSRLLRVTALLVVADAAAWVGLVDFLRHRPAVR
jgi:glycosyltransferase involved in cell wall biosynthesis